MNSQSRSLPLGASPQTRPRCSSPTKGMHCCISCHNHTARVTAQGWRQTHPEGHSFQGLAPGEHPQAMNDNLEWRLFSWICDTCMYTWYSYKYYLAVDEVDPNNLDCTPLPESMFKPLPSVPTSAAPTPMSDNSPASFGSTPFPLRKSSLTASTWSNSQTAPAGFDPIIPMDFNMAPMSESASIAGAMATAEYRGNLSYIQPNHHYKHASAPVFPTADMMDFDMDSADRRRSEPAGRRGKNFDNVNYTLMRSMGACSDCKAKRRKCDPSHPRFEMPGNAATGA